MSFYRYTHLKTIFRPYTTAHVGYSREAASAHMVYRIETVSARMGYSKGAISAHVGYSIERQHLHTWATEERQYICTSWLSTVVRRDAGGHGLSLTKCQKHAKLITK